MLLAAVFMLFRLTTRGQVIPEENSALNYRLVGFSFPSFNKKNTTRYTLEIAEGIIADPKIFAKANKQSLTATKNQILTEVPTWGKSYTWRVIYAEKNGSTESELHHFSVQPYPMLKGNEARVLVTKPAKQHKDGYFFCDGHKALYNMKGEAVWFLPAIDGINPDEFDVRDFKLSPAGTITLQGNNWPYEIRYDGTVLWKAPKKPSEGTFHHEFKRFPNGHYMVFGTESVNWCKCRAGECDSTSILAPGAEAPTGAQIVQVPFCTLVEFDNRGNVVWRWRSLEYFKRSDIFNNQGFNGFANLDAHVNAFYFDQDKNKIYLSFKDINRITVISYPSGKLLAEYGDHFEKGCITNTSRIFSEQHAIKKSKIDGSLYVFNDNIDHATSPPSVVVFKEQDTKGIGPAKVWEFSCPTGPVNYPPDIVKLDRHGGNVQELADRSFFVSMCSPYWNLLLVNRQKQVQWEATPQHYNKSTRQWETTTSYRSHFIAERTRIEQMVLGDATLPVAAEKQDQSFFQY